MKVAYNACFGGFGLSPLAETEYQAKKGVTLTWYEGVGRYPYKSYRKIRDIAGLTSKGGTISDLVASNTDLGNEVEKIPADSYFYQCWHEDENRADPDLIEVIERLGDSASGDYAAIKLKEIPDGAAFEIDEYDGLEQVVPPRMSW